MKITDRINTLIGGGSTPQLVIKPVKTVPTPSVAAPKSKPSVTNKQASDYEKAMDSATKNTKLYR